MWRLTKAQAVQGIPDGLAPHSFNTSVKEANDMSSIETLLRRRLLVPAPSPLPVSGLGKLAVLVSTRASPSPAFGLTGLTVAVTNNAWRRDSVRGRPVDGRGEKREASSSQSTCSLAQQFRLSDGARFRGCVSCMDTTLIPLENGTDQIHVRSALHGEDKMDISSHGRLEPVKRFHLPLCQLDAL